jgi:transcriptional regulator with XRE-family HTH domain
MCHYPLESGLARSYLGGVERGQRNIALVNLCKLASTLDLPLAQLMDIPLPPGSISSRS